jgi:hypothetical protein
MSITVLTTLHKDGYDLYGKKNLDSWTKFFPESWNILYYSEKHQPDLDKRVTVLDFDVACPDWQKFYSAVKNKFDNDLLNKNPKRKNWYKKALRWSFKMFALLDAIEKKPSRYVIWLDADVRANTEPPDNWVAQCLQNKSLAAQLESLKVGSHIETGILIFDTHHPDISKIVSWIEQGYRKCKILDEDKAWDGIWMAKLLTTYTISWNKLWMVRLEKTSSSVTNKNLSWLSHRVGKRKFDNLNIDSKSGRTKDQELI